MAYTIPQFSGVFFGEKFLLFLFGILFFLGCARPDPGELPSPAPTQPVLEKGTFLSKVQNESFEPALETDASRLPIQSANDAGSTSLEPAISPASEKTPVASLNETGIPTVHTPKQTAVTQEGAGALDSTEVLFAPPEIAYIEIRPSITRITVGTNQAYTLFATDSRENELSGLNIHWKSKNKAVARIDRLGLVTGIHPGKTRIVAKTGKQVVSFRLTVKPPSLDKEPMPPTQSLQETPALQNERSETLSVTGISEKVFFSGITGRLAGTGHPDGFAGEAEQAGRARHPIALDLSELPKDRYGLVDWAEAIKKGRIKPRFSLEEPSLPEDPPLDLDIVIFTKSDFQPDVIFPHYVHTLWLSCGNCHPSIFPMDAKKANALMTMPKIAAGEFCGRCHNRVAFPLSDCLRCHIKPKDVPPLDPRMKGRITFAVP